MANSGTQQDLQSSEYWIEIDLIGSTTNSSSNELNQLLDGGDFGIGEYSFTISVTVNDGGATIPFPCSNGDSDESVDWTVYLIALDYTLTEIKE